MRIEAIETKVYRIPPTIPWEDSIHKISGIEWIVTEITTDNKLTGIGWSYTVGFGATSVKALIDDYLAPMVEDQLEDLRDILDKVHIYIVQNGQVVQERSMAEEIILLK